MVAHLRNVQWVGGPQDGAVIAIPQGATWVAVLEDRRSAEPITPTEGKGVPRSLQRYSVPVINGRIIWAQRVEANPEEGDR